MLLQLPTGRVRATASCRPATGLSSASAPARKDGRASATRSHQCLALAVALGQLPTGRRLVIRDISGREWCISPAREATFIELRGAA